MNLINNFTYPFRDFYRRVRNVLRWLPTIWKDRDWDNSYITEILIRKLEFTRDFYLSDKPYSSEAKRTADEIQEAITRLHQTRDSWEFYEDPALEQLELKWGQTTYKSIPYQYDKDGNVLTYRMETVYDKEKVYTPEHKEQYSKEFKEVLQTARKQYMKDKIKAYKFIAKNIDKWWD
jgi:hypothetical protein